MKRISALSLLLAVSACGGGSSAPAPIATPSPSPTAAPTSTPSSGFVTPTFTITVPSGPASAGRKPRVISSAALSIKITLTADSAGIAPTSLSGNPAITNLSGCASGCTVSGPPSPIGSDTFTLTTYDAMNAGGNALDTNTGTYTIVQGQNNAETITLAGIVATLALQGVNFTANASTSTGVTLTAKDAAGITISGPFSNSVTIADPDTNGDGTSLTLTTCPTYPTGNPTVTATSVSITSATATPLVCYGGIAENNVTLTASATGVTSATSTIAVTLHAPAFTAGSGSPAALVTGSAPPTIDLFAPTGTGSTASVLFTEAGWTNAPFDQTLGATAGTCTLGGPLSTFATLASAYTSTGTQVTLTSVGAPVASACPISIGDGLTSNTTDATAALDATYTTTGFTVNARPR